MSSRSSSAGSDPGAPGTRRKLLTDVGVALGSRLLMLPLAMAASIVVSRALEPAGKGIYTTALTLMMVALAIGGLAFDRASTYLLASRHGEPGRVRSAGLTLSLINGLAITALVIVAAATLLPSLLPELSTAAVIAAAPLAAISLVRQVLEGFLRGKQRNHAVNLLAVVSSASFLALLLVVELTDTLEPRTAVALKVASAAVAAVGALLLLPRGGRGFPLGVHRPTARTMIAYSWPFSLVVLAQNLNYDVDVLFVQGLLGNQEVGWYSISTTLAELLWYLPMAVGFVLFPRSAAVTDEAAAQRQAATLLRWTLLLTLVGAAVLALICGPLVDLAFGERFGPAVGPLRLLLPGIVANAFYQVLGSHMLGRGDVRAIRNITAVGAVVNIALNLALLRAVGLEAASIASSVSYSVVALLVLRRFRRRSGLPLGQLLLPSAAEARERWRALRA
jgi:O-antigen/teichoic acid export membrane protein